MPNKDCMSCMYWDDDYGCLLADFGGDECPCGEGGEDEPERKD